MTQKQPNVQAIRAVSRTISRPSTPNPNDIIYIQVYTDPETKNRFVLWDDIRQVFGDALHVRHEAKALPFLKGADYHPLKPFRIAAVPNVVLDVHVSEQKASSTTQAEVSPPLPAIASAPAPQQPSGLDQIRQHASHYPKYDPLTALQSNPAPQPLVPTQQPSVMTPVHVLNNDNKEASLKHVEEAAKKSTKAAYVNLELLNEQGDTSPEDHKKVVECYLMNTHQGLTKTLISVGDLLFEGEGVTQDKKAALEWYLKAASQGDTFAQAKVDALLLSSRDEVQTSERLGDAFENSSVCTEDTLTTRVVDDASTTTRDSGEERDVMIESIASMTIVDQQDNDDELPPYDHHPTTRPQRPQQPRSTFSTYFESDTISIVICDAKEGNKDAQFALGERYRLGKGVLQDDKVALDWILKAAQQGDGAAQYQAGQMYEEGLGTETGKDLNMGLAATWYRKAAEGCVADAQERYMRLRNMGYR
ncbi:hypothetical protein EC957_005807 [Mortierella hygrophila]|uniref:HCP-like protein n=1 Tax=Mortierella hygrophila TaxID=979708 RepID=A0A9P6F0P3_9FUNG|nr:hypothetical protein EC957_005807 [Mortierella hygrophila]